jgi:hypothetical protein
MPGGYAGCQCAGHPTRITLAGPLPGPSLQQPPNPPNRPPPRSLQPGRPRSCRPQSIRPSPGSRLGTGSAQHPALFPSAPRPLGIPPPHPPPSAPHPTLTVPGPARAITSSQPAGKPAQGHPLAVGSPEALPASGTANPDTPARHAPNRHHQPALPRSHPLHAALTPSSLRLVPVTSPGQCRSGWLSSRLSAPAALAWPFDVAMTAMVTSLTEPVACTRAARHSPYVTSGDTA